MHGIDTVIFIYLLICTGIVYFPPNFSKCFVSQGSVLALPFKDVGSSRSQTFSQQACNFRRDCGTTLAEYTNGSWDHPRSPWGRMTLGVSSVLAKLGGSRRWRALRQQPPGCSSPQRPGRLHHTCNGRQGFRRRCSAKRQDAKTQVKNANSEGRRRRNGLEQFFL